MATIRVQHEPIDVGAEFAALMSDAHGATRTDIGGVGSFIGTVRGTAKGRPITEMALEHYPGMTERALSAIADQAAARWNLLAATIIHRVGPMAPGETIVLVLAASPHRHDALEATAFLIDWLKTKAPFWKREEWADGTTRWVEAKGIDDDAAERW